MYLLRFNGPKLVYIAYKNTDVRSVFGIQYIILNVDGCQGNLFKKMFLVDLIT